MEIFGHYTFGYSSKALAQNRSRAERDSVKLRVNFRAGNGNVYRRARVDGAFKMNRSLKY